MDIDWDFEYENSVTNYFDKYSPLSNSSDTCSYIKFLPLLIWGSKLDR